MARATISPKATKRENNTSKKRMGDFCTSTTRGRGKGFVIGKKMDICCYGSK
jgi:hypothetical protein